MINTVAEAPSTPIVEGAPKQDQQSGASGFLAMLTGIVSAQPDASGQVAPKAESADAETPSADAGESDQASVAATLTMAAMLVPETPVQSQQPVQMQTQPEMVVVSQQSGQTEQVVAETAEQAAEKPAQVVAFQMPTPDSKAEGEITQKAASTVSPEQVKPEAEAEEAQPENAVQPAQAEETVEPTRPHTEVEYKEVQPTQPDVIEALQDMTVQQPEAKTLPEAASPESEIAASIVAARLNPTGQNALSGEILPNSDGESTVKAVDSNKPAKNIAASAIAGSKKPEQTPSDAETRIQVEWKPSEPVSVSPTSGGRFEDSLQFANGGSQQAEPKDVSIASGNPQAFGVEMKSQLGTEPIVRQAQAAPAQAPQTDPTLGEKMVGQIVKEVSLHKMGENTTLSIRLDPPELGSVRVSVTSQSGVLTTQIESPNAVVRGILETHLPALKEALTSAGIDVSKFSVSSGLDFGANAQRQQQAWQPTRFAPAVEFNPQMAEMQPEIQVAMNGGQTQSASFSWLA